MNKASQQRRVWLAIGAGLVLSLLLVCTGLGYVAYRSIHTIVDTYETIAPPAVNGVIMDIDVRPQHRINDGFGDRLVGPPYDLMFHLRDPSGQTTRACLHAVRIVTDEGSEFPVAVTKGDNPISEHGFVLLYARIEREPMGTHPQIIVDVELFGPTRSVRDELTFSLRRRSRAGLNIP